MAIRASLVGVAFMSACSPHASLNEKSPLADDPWNATVMLFKEGYAFCSGVLVAQDVVITAGHCLDRVDFTRVEVIGTGEVNGAGPAEQDGQTWHSSIADVVFHPDYDGQTLRMDVASLRLVERSLPRHPIAIVPPSRMADQVLIDHELRIFGFGKLSDPDEHGEVKRKKHMVTARIDEADDSELVLSATGENTCDGDSGGPGFVVVDHRRVFVAVTSYGDPSCEYFGVSSRIDGDAFALQAATDRTNGSR